MENDRGMNNTDRGRNDREKDKVMIEGGMIERMMGEMIQRGMIKE